MRGRDPLYRGDDNSSGQHEPTFIAACYSPSAQDVFVIPDGAPGALAELERRKFTAEEGVRISGKVHFVFQRIARTHVLSGSHYSAKWYSRCDTDGLVRDSFLDQPTMPLSNTGSHHLGVDPTRFPSARCPELYPSDLS